jgi:ADP-heptose:LPS heptosyltransferase
MNPAAGTSHPLNSSTERRRILVFRIGSMGDALVALPSFKALRKREPDAEIILLTNAPTGGGVKAAPSFLVLQGSGAVDSYLEYKQGNHPIHMLRLLFALRTLKLDKAVYLMPLRSKRQRLRDALFLRLAGCRVIEGIEASKVEEKRIFLMTQKRYESEASRLLRVVSGNPLTLTEADFSLELNAAELELAERSLPPRLAGAVRLVISIGTKSPANDWGQVNWLKLLRLISEQNPTAFLILIGSKDEYARSEDLGASFYDRHINLCGKLSPRQSAAVLAVSDLYIGHDSGPMHLAAAVATPLIGIFSARNLPGVWFPFGANSKIFYNHVECAGCGLEVCTEQAMRCIRAITPEAVAREAAQMLNQPSGGNRLKASHA